MLTIETNITKFFPTLAAASTIAAANMAGDSEWMYVCESYNDGKTWAVAIYDEDGIHIGYIG